MQRVFHHALILASTLAFTSFANAGLNGTSATTNLTVGVYEFPANPPTNIVGPGYEGEIFGRLTFDYDDLSFKMTALDDMSRLNLYFLPAPADPSELVTVKLSGLNFGGVLTDVLVDTPLSGVNRSFGTDWVTFTWSDHSVQRGDFLLAQFVVAAPVPEPETYSMVLAGLGLLGIVARRRKQKTVA